jgi:hypothetical protein
MIISIYNPTTDHIIIYDNGVYRDHEGNAYDPTPLLVRHDYYIASAQKSNGELLLLGDRTNIGKIEELYTIGSFVFAVINGQSYGINSLQLPVVEN